MGAKIVAIVPCHNRKEKTLRFLQQIYRQTYCNLDRLDIALDIVVVDAASTDGTSEAISQYYPAAILLQVSAADYWSATTNAGVRFALANGYDYILTINDDSMIATDHVQILVETAQQHQTKILGSRIDYLTEPGMVWALGTSVTWGPRILKLNGHNVPEEELPESWQKNPLISVDTMPGNGVLIHRSVFEDIGLYHDRMLPHYHADSEFVMRANREGIQSFVTGKTILYDDSPPPNIQHQENSKRPDRFWLLDFWETFFHPRSGWYLKARVYLILTYCPRVWVPITLLQGTIGVMLGWLGQRAMRWIKCQSHRPTYGKSSPVS
jgi:GT2 family glycosyltransferase